MIEKTQNIEKAKMYFQSNLSVDINVSLNQNLIRTVLRFRPFYFFTKLYDCNISEKAEIVYIYMYMCNICMRHMKNINFSKRYSTISFIYLIINKKYI